MGFRRSRTFSRISKRQFDSIFIDQMNRLAEAMGFEAPVEVDPTSDMWHVQRWPTARLDLGEDRCAYGRLELGQDRDGN